MAADIVENNVKTYTIIRHNVHLETHEQLEANSVNDIDTASISNMSYFITNCFLFMWIDFFTWLWLYDLKWFGKPGPSWSWSFGGWIYNYLCNQSLSLVKLWVFDTTLCNTVFQWLAAKIKLPRNKPDSNLFISWKCFIVFYLQIHRHTNKISQFWSVCFWFRRKTNAKRNLIGFWTTKERIW